MNELHYLLTDVFTDEPYAGNPLAVFLDGDGLSGQAMQVIARELNISECAFVLSPAGADHHFAVRIFTPKMELPFAGHPTIGTALALYEAGRLDLAPGEPLRLAMEAGLVEVAFELQGERPRAILSAPQVPGRLAAPPPTEDLARMVGLGEADLGPAAPAAYSAGVPYTLIPVRTKRALRRARLDLGLWRELIAGGPAPHVYLFTLEDEPEIEARMFAPAMGIEEDPATGAAVSALAGLLFDLGETFEGSREFPIVQGLSIGRRSEIGLVVEAAENRIAAVRVAGGAVAVGRGTIIAPPR